MMKNRSFFPKKLFLSWLKIELFWVTVLLVVGFMISHVLLETHILGPHASPETLSELKVYFFNLFVFLISLFFILSAYHTLKILSPLGRILRQIDAEKSDSKDTFTQAEVEEPGEWSDLEIELHQLFKRLQKELQTSARESSEVEALMSAVSSGILAVTQDLQVLFYNSQFAVQFSSRLPQGDKPRLHEIIRTVEVLEAYQRAIQEGVSLTLQSSLSTENLSGAEHFSISVAPLRDQSTQKIYGAIGIFHDITDVVQAQKIRADFVANVSHELRTPLTAIKGYIDTIQKDIQEKRYEEVDRFLSVVVRNADRLLLLVDDILDLSSLESGKAMNKADVSVRELTEQVVRDLHDKTESRKQSVVTSFQTKSVHADPKRVEQVLNNLIDNAIKYAPSNSQVKVVWEDGNQKNTLLRVIDNGPGIPKEHLARLFERFYRIDKGRSRQLGGTGLGLAIVKHIMQAHGGQVTVKSAQGQGTEFVCSFPHS